MLKVGGFNELKPEQKIIEERIFGIVKKNYQKFGYTPIETPGVEKNEVLTAKGGGEVGNQILGIYGLAQGASDLKKYSLHFDLTVPFARYVLDYRGELTFPFKRSQIQKVWRGERQQRGRSREFYQADIDVIWEESPTKDYLFYDSEVVSIGYKTYLEIFKAFDLDLKIKVNINNKKIISGFIGALGLGECFTELSAIIDAKDKMSPENFRAKLDDELSLNTFTQGLSWEYDVIQKIIDFTEFEANSSNLDEVKTLAKPLSGILTPSQEQGATELNKGINELETVLKNLFLLGVKEEDVVVNLGIIRGLEYYTGTIFETFIEGDRKLGSIASGGRYEGLTKFLDKKANFSGVGFSMGITRFEDYLFEKIDTANLAKTTSEYLVINFEDTLEESVKLFNNLSETGKKIEFYPESDKLVKQFKYADKKGIKHCILLGKGELEKNIYTIKNLETGESEEIEL